MRGIRGGIRVRLIVLDRIDRGEGRYLIEVSVGFRGRLDKVVVMDGGRGV